MTKTVKPTKRSKLSPAQVRALTSARDFGNPTYHLSGQADWGGWGGTRVALQRRGYLDVACRITDAGRRALGGDDG